MIMRAPAQKQLWRRHHDASVGDEMSISLTTISHHTVMKVIPLSACPDLEA